MSDKPSIDIEAERKDFERDAIAHGMSARRLSTDEYVSPSTAFRLSGWLARARLAAERERSLLDLLADAQHAVCCYSCPEPREGEPDRHCETCVRIGEALTRKGPSDDTPEILRTEKARNA